MAEIVLGIASSHGPQLRMRPEVWREYGDRGRKQATHWYAGKTYTFEELAELRASDHFERECTDETFQRRFDACQAAIAHLGETLRTAAPDVCILIGDDQHEAFFDENMPVFAVYNGETVDDAPPSGRGLGGMIDTEVENAPKERISHPTDAVLADHLIGSLIEAGFDVARTSRLPDGRDGGVIGHAFHYLYRRLMGNQVIPHVPIMVNTYYPPNVPTARRSYALGRELRRAVESWDSNARVAIMASGGLSHTVIEEDFDARVLDGLKHDDFEKLTGYPDVRFRGGTSEIKNWIALGGAMSGTGLDMSVVDYVPCYRTEAGNGCAMGFAEWLG